MFVRKKIYLLSFLLIALPALLANYSCICLCISPSLYHDFLFACLFLSWSDLLMFEWLYAFCCCCSLVLIL